MRKKKTFDCVAMKERGEKAVYEKIKGMTLNQEILCYSFLCLLEFYT